MAAQYTLGQRLGQYHYNDFVYANQQLADPEIQVRRLDDETMAMQSTRQPARPIKRSARSIPTLPRSITP